MDVSECYTVDDVFQCVVRAKQDAKASKICSYCRLDSIVLKVPAGLRSQPLAPIITALSIYAFGKVEIRVTNSRKHGM